MVDYSFVIPRTKIDGLQSTLQIVKRVKPDIFLVAYRGWLKGAEFCLQYDIEMVLLPRINRISTSQIINKIKS